MKVCGNYAVCVYTHNTAFDKKGLVIGLVNTKLFCDERKYHNNLVPGKGDELTIGYREGDKSKQVQFCFTYFTGTQYGMYTLHLAVQYRYGICNSTDLEN